MNGIKLNSENVIEDSATGSVNACFLAYPFKNNSDYILTTEEQGFQMNRKSDVQLQGNLHNGKSIFKVDSKVVELNNGIWRIW